MSPLQSCVLLTVVAMYLLVILKQEFKQWFALVAAVILIALKVISVHDALFVAVNWNVLMIYIGSMIIAELFIFSGEPARIADVIIEKSPSTVLAIVAILVMTGIISIFVENVATVLVMAPIALALCKKLKMNPTYFMVGVAVMSNLQGTATLVGDPPSMIFANFTGYGFNDFFFHAGRLSIFWAIQFGMLVGAIYFYFLLRRYKQKPPVLERSELRSYVPSILLISMILGLMVASMLQSGVGLLSGGLVLLLGIAGALWYAKFHSESDKSTWEMLKGLDWETPLFLIGIFIVVGAIERSGLLVLLAGAMESVIAGNAFTGFCVIVLVSVVISGFVDNVPYIMVMLPVAHQLALSLGIPAECYMFALLVGSCLGGNLTPFGASANIVSVGILKKNGVKANFSTWLKVAGPFTVLTTFAASLLVWGIWG